ncbi:hypothetical protein SFK218_1897 [Shigella flexneri K-218]|nr:hypothetical protein SF434370_1541 [Shigella flexneri 4343-70]EGK25200.1 hypothetical protein SFK218_1897 [Shigella flexneri K-218]EJL15682.1 hypothetical protein SF660363_1440 [Shigella flexneri 6603-63]
MFHFHHPAIYADVGYIKHQLLPNIVTVFTHQRFFAFWS